MSAFANRDAFEDPRNRLRAMGTNMSAARAIVDHAGNVVARPSTGGMLVVSRIELHPGTTLYRFGGSQVPPLEVAKGEWWIAKSEFERLVSFANSNDICVGLAMRLLCLVPPEWTDAGWLVRARVARSVLAWRGLGNSVVTPMTKGGGTVNMPHQNAISERRLHQLFVPGLRDVEPHNPAITVQQVFRLDPAEGSRGFLYL